MRKLIVPLLGAWMALGAGLARADALSLTVGVLDATPPLAYTAQGERRGFEIDVARELARRLGESGAQVGLEMRTVTIQNRFARLRAGTVDLLIASVADAPRWRAEHASSVPYYITDVALYARLAGEARNLEDLQGRTIGVLKNTAAVDLVSRIAGARVMLVEEMGELIQLLREGAIAAAAVNVVAGEGILRTLGESYGPILTVGAQGFVVALADQRRDLLEPINAALRRMASDGELGRLAQANDLPRARLSLLLADREAPAGGVAREPDVQNRRRAGDGAAGISEESSTRRSNSRAEAAPESPGGDPDDGQTRSQSTRRNPEASPRPGGAPESASGGGSGGDALFDSGRRRIIRDWEEAIRQHGFGPERSGSTASPGSSQAGSTTARRPPEPGRVDSGEGEDADPSGHLERDRITREWGEAIRQRAPEASAPPSPPPPPPVDGPGEI